MKMPYMPNTREARPRIVCICGSTKFKDAINGVAQRETLKGHIVLTHGFFHHVDRVPITDKQKAMLDELMLEKVRLADRVVIVNINGYIGQSTRAAIEFATKHDKPIEYLEYLGSPSPDGRG